MASFHELQMRSITGEQIDFSTFRDKVCLVVNVASQWGLTPQYAGLRALQEEFEDQGFTVLGFPCNQFGQQEPGTDEEILEFARSRYDVNFPMFSKIEVNGEGACELYTQLKHAQPGEGESSDITWNFEKFLVGRDGSVLARWSPMTTPEEIGQALPEYL
jgi:glutathione peroxidase